MEQVGNLTGARSVAAPADFAFPTISPKSGDRQPADSAIHFIRKNHPNPSGATCRTGCAIAFNRRTDP